MLWSIRYRSMCWLLRLLVRCGLDELDLEKAVLRHQLKVLRRGLGRAVFTTADRTFLAASARVLSRDRWRSFLVAPDTLVRWHRDLLSRHVRGSRRPGRPPLDPSIKHLVLRLGRENPRWCYLRIRGELLKLGIDVSATTIATVLRQGDLGPPRPAGSGRPGRSSCGCRPTASSPSAPPERRRVRRTWHRIRGSCRLGYARPQARPRKTRPSMTILLHRCDGPSPPRKLRGVRPWPRFRDALELALRTGPRWLPNWRSRPDGLSPHSDLGMVCHVRSQMEPRPEIQDLV